MVKALSFKGDPKPKKRKRPHPSAPDSLSTTALPDNDSARPVPTNEDDDDDDAAAAADSTIWVLPDSASEISGPVMLIFPALSPPQCLATDANGAVYGSAVENMVEGSPGSAEPSDVRQVWVATRVAGQGAAEVGLRGSNGRFLGVEFGAGGGGRVAAGREARGVEEGWALVGTGEALEEERERERVSREVQEEGKDDDEEKRPHETDTAVSALAGLDTAAPTFHLRTAKGTYLTATPSPLDPAKTLLQAKRATPGADSAVIVKMQARFKPRLEKARKERAYEKIGRAQIEREAGRVLDEEEVRRLKKARKRGTYHEEMLDVRAKGKHDKFA